jgi:hypothetical protein
MALGPLPTGVPQLDGSPQAKVNCGPATGASGLSHADLNMWVPVPSAVRAWGNMGVGPTDLTDMKRAVESISVAGAFKALGLEAPTLVRLGYVPFAQFLTTLVRPRLFHAVPIKYEVVTEHPEYAGDKDFKGLHFVGAVRIYEAVEWAPGGVPSYFHRVRPRGLQRVIKWLPADPDDWSDVEYDRFWTVVVDPLADGRRPNIPRAPQLWPLALLLQAGDQFRDTNPRDGKLSAGVIDRAAPMGGPQS